MSVSTIRCHCLPQSQLDLLENEAIGDLGRRGGLGAALPTIPYQEVLRDWFATLEAGITGRSILGRIEDNGPLVRHPGRPHHIDSLGGGRW